MDNNECDHVDRAVIIGLVKYFTKTYYKFGNKPVIIKDDNIRTIISNLFPTITFQKIGYGFNINIFTEQKIGLNINYLYNFDIMQSKKTYMVPWRFTYKNPIVIFNYTTKHQMDKTRVSMPNNNYRIEENIILQKYYSNYLNVATNNNIRQMVYNYLNNYLNTCSVKNNIVTQVVPQYIKEYVPKYITKYVTVDRAPVSEKTVAEKPISDITAVVAEDKKAGVPEVKKNNDILHLIKKMTATINKMNQLKK